MSINRRPSSTISTTNVILDYLLYLSINARLEQAKNDLQYMTEEQLQSATFYCKKGQDVKPIVEVFDKIAFISQTSSTRAPYQNSSTNSAYSQFASPTPPSSVSQKQKSSKLPANLLKYEKHFKNPLLSRCRKHRLKICSACLQHPDNSSTITPWSRRRTTPPKPIPSRKTATGLIDAIPVFIHTSVITYRIANEQLDFDNDYSLIKPLWYDLLLDLLTQAAIECYFCDSYSSIDTLLEIFSYGDIDPSDYHSDDSESDDDDDSHFAANRADDYLLWQRTPYLDEFRQKKKARMEEFLNVKGKLEQHFENLARKYPIRDLEIEMYNFCSKINSNYMKIPELITLHKASTNPDLPVELFHIPGKYNGGINIPISNDDSDDDMNVQISDSCNHCEDGQKKRHILEDNEIKQLKKRKNLTS
ncbi:4334_t:CDS:2 [Dentiscutata erythropus]|uniref:4334_t:CDS:1 n=1 Tax=Dentiscutata erythropus TaxID=1348616 RepID=A0A9N9N8C3_9GLOM|nr:4334_t:CDS:2 [Dentiscutata erythropus]